MPSQLSSRWLQVSYFWQGAQPATAQKYPSGHAESDVPVHVYAGTSLGMMASHPPPAATSVRKATTAKREEKRGIRKLRARR